jgi:hypothetical protein
MFPGMSWSIRIGVPSAGDPEGITGPGSWWLTGSCCPAILPDGGERARAGRARRIFRLRWRTRRRLTR